MNGSSPFHVPLVLTLFAAASSLGCAPGYQLQLTKVGFNPKFSLDRVPVQDEPDPTLGTFRAGPGQSASYLYPEVGEAHRLMQGECYWLAHDSTESAGDFVKLNWEAVMEVQPDLGDGLRFAPGDNRFTLCRLDHPVERRNPEIIEGTADPIPVAMTLPTDSASYLNLPDLEEGTLESRHESDLEVLWNVELTELEDGAANPDRLCIPQRMTDSPTNVVADYKFYGGSSSPENWVNSCSFGGIPIRPDVDASYVVHWGDPTDLGPGASALWLRPNLMVVDGDDELARPMTEPAAGTWEWSTPVTHPAPAEPTPRWGENFSPSLTVEAVRFFTRDESGVKAYFDSEEDLRTDELCVRRTPDVSLLCNWSCRGALIDGVLTFDLTGNCSDTQGDPVEVAFTPTYDKKKLQIPDGDPITEPLSWSIEPREVADPLYIEFDVVADVSSMAVKTDPLLALGSMAQGDTKRAEVRVVNVGGKTVSVDSIGIDPGYGDAGDFDSWILDRPKPVPIPVELEDRGSEGYELGKADDWEEFPVIETTDAEDYTLGRIATYDRGAEFAVNGYRLMAVGSQLFYDDPEADFQAPLPKGVSRPFHVLAFSLLQAPFNLSPGESVLVTVSATPTDYGEREAHLRIDYSDALDPSSTGTVLTAVTAFGLWGPDASVQPAGVYVSPVGSLPQVRTVLLINNGDMALERTGFLIDGRDAAAFSVVSPNPAKAPIDGGEAEVFEIEFAPDCLAPPTDDYQAELILTTADEELIVPMVGASALCP